MPDWLSRKVGEEGQVLATDIDVSHLGATGLPANVTVRRHDIGADPPPPETFHLVHARLVLVHVLARGDALRAMASRLRPGGWLVVEDADPGLQPLACPDETGPATALANRLRHAFRTLLEERGADLAYARTLPRRLRALDLEDVAGECYFPLGSVESAALEAATMAQIGPRLLAAGLATATDLDRHLDNVRTGRLDLATAPMVSAWGRRPTEGQKWPLAADPAHLQ